MKRFSAPLGIFGLIAFFFAVMATLTVPEGYWSIALVEGGVGALCTILYFLSGGRILRTKNELKAAKFGAASISYSALLVVVILAINVLFVRNEFFRFDTTENKFYTLAPETANLLRDLRSKVEIRGFFLGGRIKDKKLEELLSRVTRASRYVSFELIDPEYSLKLLEEFGISQSGTLHFRTEIDGVRREVKIAREIGEEEVANALRKLLSPKSRTLYYLEGHGEPNLTDKLELGYLYLKESVEGENITVRPLQLGATGRIPSDADALIIVAPRKPILDEELGAVSAYIEGGGRVILLVESRLSEDLVRLGATLGIKIGSNIIIDQLSGVQGSSLGVQPVITNFGEHPAMEGLRKGKEYREGVILSTASSVTPDEVVPAGAKLTVLAKTGPRSWAEHDMQQLFGPSRTASFGEGDLRGPVPVAVAYEKEKSRVVVVGDADFASNLNLRQLYNRDFILNCINWVIGDEGKISIRPRTLRGTGRVLTAAEYYQTFIWTVIVFPQLLIASGLFVWWRRRQ